MSIIDSNSVLILGAGSSAPFGLSLGGDLIENLADNLEAELKRSRYDDWRILIGKCPKSAFLKSPSRSIAHIKGETFDEFEMRTKELTHRLRTSTHDTIDDFLVDNADFSFQIKVGIAAALFLQMYKSKMSQKYVSQWDGDDLSLVETFEVKDFLQRNFTDSSQFNSRKGPRNWIHLLINMVRYAVRNEFFDQKIKIISFNYDTILEHVLERLFRETQFEYGPFTDYFEIVHPHGRFTALNETDAPIETVIEWAEAICVVQESAGNLPSEISSARQTAKQWIRDCKKLYATGFAFAGANCQLLGLYSRGTFGSSGGPDELYYNNYDGNMGITQAVNRFTKPLKQSSALLRRYSVVECPDASFERPVSIEDWFASGYAGEPPA